MSPFFPSKKRWGLGSAQSSAERERSVAGIDLPTMRSAGSNSLEEAEAGGPLLADDSFEGDPLGAALAMQKGGPLSRALSCLPPWARARLAELLTFAGWHIVGIPSAIQLPFLWYFFWQHVCFLGMAVGPTAAAIADGVTGGGQPESAAAADAPHPRLFATRALVVWLLWCAAAAYYRRVLHAAAPPMVCAILRHIELFAAAGLAVTMSANICTLLHTPAEPLFDLGFTLIPAQGVDSPWRPVSDVLAQALPAVLVVRTLVMRRAARCQVLVNWLRCVSLAYIFRAMTCTLTSLPGPAPHCMNEEGYHPPSGWHDIATRMGPMVGDYSTCGDLIFSGHTAFTTMTALCLVKTFKGRRGYTLAKVLGMLYVSAMATFALAGRKHYSVDIAVAVLVSCLTFYRFQDGWAPRSGRGDPLRQDALLTKARKDTIDLPSDADLLPLARASASGGGGGGGGGSATMTRQSSTRSMQ